MNSIFTKHIGTISILSLLFGALLLLFSGCDDSGGITIPSGSTNMSVSAKNTNINGTGSALVITEAKALISNVKFEVSGNGKNEQIPVNAFVSNFVLDGSLQQLTSGYIIRENYINMKFELHKPDVSETPADPEFNTGAQDNQRFSFIIKGTYNGSAFVYRSKADANITISFSSVQNMNLQEMNVTMLFNIPDWFKNGSAILNPSDPLNETIIDSNIKNSFKQAFLDNNKDGSPDN